MKTVFVTGCSSGFGLETARLFLARDWTVVATMRTPQDDVLPRSERLRVLALDVTDPESIRRAVAEAGPIDALVNNAGFGLLGVFEDTSMDTVRDVFETNTLGTMAVTRAVLPQMRERRAGVVVNVTSSVTLGPLPLVSVYTASKAAINAFTDSLSLELAPFGVRVALVLPGQSRETRFRDNARVSVDDVPEAYREFTQGVFARMTGASPELTRSIDVAEAVWRAVTDPASPMRQPAGADAVAWASTL